MRLRLLRVLVFGREATVRMAKLRHTVDKNVRQS